MSTNLAGIPPAYHRDEHDIVSMSGSEDLSAERDLVEEIQLRTAQFPLTKQDSYANAIYSAAAKQQQKRLRKQGSYKAAVETGVKKQAAIKRTKEIMQIRKQACRQFNSLFMCQDEDENEDENQSFGSFWNLCATNEPILQ